MSDLLANLSAFKNRNKVVSPSLKTETTNTVIPASPAPKRELSDDESDVEPKKYKHESNVHLSTQLLIATEYIREKGEPVPLSQLRSYMSWDADSKLLNLITNIDKIRYNPQKKTVQYVSMYDVHGEEDLLHLLRKQVTFKGISVKDLKDGWPQCMDVIDDLEKAGRILVLRTKKDNSARYVWYNSGGDLGLIDPEFVNMWDSIKLPQRAELPRKLNDLGLKPASVDPATIKKAPTKVETKKRKQRRSKITNTHMAGILKDYSDRV